MANVFLRLPIQSKENATEIITQFSCNAPFLWANRRFNVWNHVWFSWGDERRSNRQWDYLKFWLTWYYQFVIYIFPFRIGCFIERVIENGRRHLIQSIPNCNELTITVLNLFAVFFLLLKRCLRFCFETKRSATMKRNKWKIKNKNEKITTTAYGKCKCVLVEQMQKVRLSTLHFKRMAMCVIWYSSGKDK